MKFDIAKFSELTGLDLKESVALDYLKKLGFKVKSKLVEVPENRTDISTMEDLAEEIVNLYGYGKLPDMAPRIPIAPAAVDESVVLKEKIRGTLRSFGMSEVYNYSFVSRKDLTAYADPKWWGAVALLNPVSADFHYLRPDLSVHLLKNLEDNLRFYDQVRIFEVGKIFSETDGNFEERPALGIAIGLKKGNPILELKGAVDGLLKSLGLTDYFFRDQNWDIKYLVQENSLRVESGDHKVIGNLGSAKTGDNFAVAQIYLDTLLKLAVEEKEYEPLPKYPSVARDISLFVPRETRIDDLMAAMERSAPLFLDDVDMIDYYEEPNVKEKMKSATFRLVFQADDKTLTDEEVGKEMEKIISVLQEKFSAEIR